MSYLKLFTIVVWFLCVINWPQTFHKCFSVIYFLFFSVQLGDVGLSVLEIGEICPVSLVSGSGDALKLTQDKTDVLASNPKVRK